ncbi:MAG: hypothetical protein EA350_08400 [Gemmatimonadales bacterium]|nr:MAG: hypothetical protein EA350_08400 [Gemmatimonadales bacterium]
MTAILRRTAILLTALLVACSDGGPETPQTPSAQSDQVVPEASYGGESHPVSIQVRFPDGTPASGIAVVWSGDGQFSGSASTGTDGRAEGTWTLPAAFGPATLRATMESGEVTFTTSVVTRGATSLEVLSPSSAMAGAPYVVTVRVLDGKGTEITQGSPPAGSLRLYVDGDQRASVSLQGGAHQLSTSDTVARAYGMEVRHVDAPTSGAAAGTAPTWSSPILVTSGGPSRLVVQNAGQFVGREDDLSLSPPQLNVRDAFGNPVSSELEFVVGGGGEAFPRRATIPASGSITLDSLRFGSGPEAGLMRVVAPADTAEVNVPVSARVQASAIAVTGLPQVIFEGETPSFEIIASGAQGVAAYAPYEVRYVGESGLALVALAASPGALLLRGRLGVQGRSGSISLAPLPLGRGSLVFRVDDFEVTSPVDVREPPLPGGIVILSGDGQEAFVGSTLNPLSFRVVDQYGEPIAVPVAYAVTGGTITGSSQTTAAGQGSATWTLPAEPGSFEATVRAGSGENSVSVAYTAESLAPPEIHTFVVVSGAGQTGVRGSPLPEPLVVEARDQYGSPMAAPLTWSGDGSFAPASQTTSASTGRAETVWTLPDALGEVAGTVRAGGIEVSLAATAVEGPRLSGIVLVSGNNQGGETGSTLGGPLVVETRDQFGDPIAAPVSFSGPGAFTPSSGTSGANGRFQAAWTLPESAGNHLATAAAGAFSVQFAADAVAPPPTLPAEIDGHHVVQVSQSEDQGVTLVQGRGALFRGFVRRTGTGDVGVRLIVRNGGAVVQDVPITIAQPIPSTTPSRSDASTTFTAEIPGSHVQAGMSYTFRIESGELSSEVTRSPAVLARDPLHVRFIPIRVDSTGTVGDVNASSMGTYMGLWEGLPFPSATGEMRPEYLYTGPPVTEAGSTWTRLIGEVQSIRIDDGSSALYYGVVQREGPSAGVAGIGYVGYPTSVGASNYSTGIRRIVFNHEVGHNLNQMHSPCGNASGTDPNYPHADGRMGEYGMWLGSITPPGTPDVMGYCNGIAMGPYTWNRAIAHTRWWSAFAAVAALEPGLRIWGSMEAGELRMRTPFVTRVGSPDPNPEETLEIVIRDAAGTILWSGNAALHALDHAEATTFSAGVPMRLLEGTDGIVIEVARPTGTRRFGLGELPAAFGDPDTGIVMLPEMEVYRAPTGEITGFGAPGVTRPPAGDLIQEGGLRGGLFRQGAGGRPTEEVGTAGALLRELRPAR